jgi:hypothetical protein
MNHYSNLSGLSLKGGFVSVANVKGTEKILYTGMYQKLTATDSITSSQALDQNGWSAFQNGDLGLLMVHKMLERFQLLLCQNG